MGGACSRSGPIPTPRAWPASRCSAAGEGLELQVVAAVVVGGVNIFGGSGSMIGVFLGAALIDLLQQGLIRLPGVSEFIRDAILGLLILLAVASDKVIVGRLRALSIRAHRAEDEERLRSTSEAPTP